MEGRKTIAPTETSRWQPWPMSCASPSRRSFSRWKRSRHHRLTVTLPTERVFLHADPLRLEQVLRNLLANAAKFTDPGGHIQLTAETEAGQVVVRVRDNGRGIDPDLLPQLFHRFQRGPCGAQNPGGLGLGLALVKSLVELHGGSVEAWSDGPGTGSEFIVRLPVWDHDRPRNGSQPYAASRDRHLTTVN